MEATSIPSIPIEGEKDKTFSVTPSSTNVTGVDQESLDRNLSSSSSSSSSGTKNTNTGSNIISTVNENPKLSMMAKSKLNFVIPKNKLSGGLVPVTRNNSKRDPTETMKEEVLQKIPSRKTKWGADLSQDIHVRRGRSLALQVFFSKTLNLAALCLSVKSLLLSWLCEKSNFLTYIYYYHAL